MTVTLRYFSEFGKSTFQHTHNCFRAQKRKVHVRYLLCWWASCKTTSRHEMLYCRRRSDVTNL